MSGSADYQHLGFEEGADWINAFYLEVPNFGFHWHYHPELEITCVRNGRGTRMIGDNVSPFSNGDFVFLGSNLPHTWISDDDFNQSSEMMEVAVLQFHPAIFESPLLRGRGMENILRLFEHAGRGVEVTNPIKDKAFEMIFSLLEVDGIEKIQLFLGLLDLLGSEESFKLLASKAYNPPLNKVVEGRIRTVCGYVHENFMQAIKLETVAEIANMNVTSFCRFFKKSTGQSLSEYITDLRIGKACNLLLDSRRLGISDIAFMSGYSSQTLFNRHFLRKKGMTPSNFRKVAKVDW